MRQGLLVAGRGITALWHSVDEFIQKWQKVIVWIEVVIITAIVISLCFNHFVDWDEAFTYNLVTRNNFLGIIEGTAKDVHPPFYYLAAKIITLFGGDSMFSVKITAVAGMALSMILSATLVRKNWGIYAALLLNLIIGLGPCILHYNLNMRMYSWTMAFTFGSALYAYEITIQSNKRNWIMFLIMSLGGAYTQYFSIITIAFIYLYLGIYLIVKKREKIRAFIGICAATIVGYSPWLAVLFKQYQSSGTSGELHVDLLKWYDLLVWNFGTNIEKTTEMVLLIFITALIIYILKFRTFSFENKLFIIMCVLNYIASCYAAVLIASTSEHFFHNRYTYHALILIWLFIIIVMANVKSWAVIPMGIWLAVICLSSYTIMYTEEYTKINELAATETWIADNVSENDTILYDFLTFDMIYSVYMPEQEFLYWEDMDLESMQGKEMWFFQLAGRYFTDNEKAVFNMEVLEVGEFHLESFIYGKIYKVHFKEDNGDADE